MRARLGRPLVGLLLLYSVASLLHFTHNAEHLADYPNLPDWLSRVQIHAAWFGITAVGTAGVQLYRRGRQRFGLIALAVYAAIGFDGLLHYARAPFAAHTTAMNVSIWFEAAAAAGLFAAVVAQARHSFQND